MSSETITRNDLKAIFDEVLPAIPTYTERVVTDANGTLVVRKTNTAVNITYAGNSKNYTHSSYTTIATLLEDERPSAYVPFCSFDNVTSNASLVPLIGKIYPNTGEVNIWVYGNNGTNVAPHFSVSYLKDRGDTGILPPTMEDFIVEQGTSGVWIYRKWNSGIAECWGTHKYTLTGWATWGTLYEGSSDGGTYYQESYPNNLFTARPFSIATVQGIGKGYLLETYNAGDATKTDGYIVVRPNNTGSLGDVYINIHAIGRWK